MEHNAKLGCMPTACKEHNLVKSAEAHNGSERHCAQKDEKSCVLHSAESTELSQRLIHGDVHTKASKEAVWRIRASDCYLPDFISFLYFSDAL
ncbi:MAG: hypothetical protein RIC35_23050 [Marinoscillum sp.]